MMRWNGVERNQKVKYRDVNKHCAALRIRAFIGLDFFYSTRINTKRHAS